MSCTYIFAATEDEARPVRQIAPGDDVVVIISGFGPTNARNNAEEALGLRFKTLPGRRPDAVLVIGLCGGLSRSLPEGRIVVYTHCLSTDANNKSIQCSPSFVDSVVAALQS